MVESNEAAEVAEVAEVDKRAADDALFAKIFAQYNQFMSDADGQCTKWTEDYCRHVDPTFRVY